MAKYNEEFKIKLVTEYSHGNLGYRLLAKKCLPLDMLQIKLNTGASY